MFVIDADSADKFSFHQGYLITFNFGHFHDHVRPHPLQCLKKFAANPENILST